MSGPGSWSCPDMAAFRSSPAPHPPCNPWPYPCSSTQRALPLTLCSTPTSRPACMASIQLPGRDVFTAPVVFHPWSDTAPRWFPVGAVSRAVQEYGLPWAYCSEMPARAPGGSPMPLPGLECVWSAPGGSAGCCCAGTGVCVVSTRVAHRMPLPGLECVWSAPGGSQMPLPDWSVCGSAPGRRWQTCPASSG